MQKLWKIWSGTRAFLKLFQMVHYELPAVTCSFTLQVPVLNPYPMDRSVVVLDNCTIHHDEEIRHIIEDECGVPEMQFSFATCTDEIDTLKAPN